MTNEHVEPSVAPFAPLGGADTVLSIDDLTSPERLVLSNARTGAWTVASTPSWLLDLETPDPEHCLRADLIAQLLTGTGPIGSEVTVRGLMLIGYEILGDIDAGFCRVDFPIKVGMCRFRGASKPTWLHGAVMDFVKFDNCTFADGLVADLAEVRDLDLNESTFEHLSLNYARVANRFAANNIEILGRMPDIDVALSAYGLYVGSDLELDGLVATQTLQLQAIEVGGDIQLSDVTVRGAGDGPQPEHSIILEYAKCQALWMTRGKLAGTLRLGHLEARAGCYLNGTTIETSDKDVAIYARRLKCSDDLFGSNLTLAGSANFSSVRVGGSLAFLASTMAELDLSGSQIEGSLDLSVSSCGQLDLSDVEVGVLDVPSKEGLRPAKLKGASFNRLESRSTTEQLLEWIRMDPEGYSPQPYRQLADRYEAQGDPGSARQVRKQAEVDRIPSQRLVGRLWARSLQVTVGFGYSPELALLWAFGAVLLGSLALSDLSSGSLWVWAVPEPAGFQSDRPEQPFIPTIYSVDAMVPGWSTTQSDWYPTTVWTGLVSAALNLVGAVLLTTVFAAVVRRVSRGGSPQ